MEKKKPGRVRVKSINHNSYYDYKKDSQKNLYKTNPEYTAKKKLQYYKKLYRENQDFKNIIENNNNIIEILLEVVNFHQKKKLNLI